VANRARGETFFRQHQLHEALPAADYVLICAPRRQRTNNLIGAAEIAKMKRGGAVINVGRGSLLDETTLVQALESGALGGAALDGGADGTVPPEILCGTRRICSSRRTPAG